MLKERIRIHGRRGADDGMGIGGKRVVFSYENAADCCAR